MRKHGGIALLLCLLLCLSLSTAAFAQNENGLGRVTDAAGLLSESQRESLERRAESISQAYECGVYIVTLEDYEEYSGDVESCAEELYRYFGLGWGEQRDGLLLLLSTEQREYDLAAYGSFGHFAFTDYGKDYLSSAFLDDFRRDDWYAGFTDYLDRAESMLRSARNNEPVDVPPAEEHHMSPLMRLVTAILPSGLVAYFTCARYKGQMKTVRRQRRADSYVVPGSAQLQVREDRFITRTQTVRRIESSRSGGGGGGGGTTVNAGGFSHHSGKF